MARKIVAVTLVLLFSCLALAGCFGMGGFDSPSQTLPPHTDFASIDEFKEAVAKAKSGGMTDDVTNLAGLSSYYTLKTLPEGAKVTYVKVAADVLRIGYSFGPAVQDSFDNQLEIAWYRNANISNFINDTAQSLGLYDTVNVNGTDYLHAIPSFQFVVTAEPGATPEATPTPRSGTYCQFLYWVKDNGAFMCAVPLGFTNEDIGKYCVAEKADLK